MKMSEKFWLAVYICSLIVPSILIYIEWETMQVFFNDRLSLPIPQRILIVWVIGNVAFWSMVAISGIPELIKLFNEWLDKQDGDEA